jgi:hypothetical protein
MGENTIMSLFETITHTKEDYQLIAKIANRAVKLYKSLDYMTMDMDLQVVHFNNPLRLQDMLDGPDNDFAHDVAGIHQNLNRDTGVIANFFTPRFTK